MEALSPHLFWDVDRTTIDWDEHRKWLVKRVLGYGLWSDWQVLVAHYGKHQLGEIAFSIPTLDPRSRAFCCAWFGRTTF